MDQLGNVETTVGRAETLSRMINHLRENNVNPSHFLLLFFRYSAPFKAAKQTYKARSALKEKLHDRSYSLHLDEGGEFPSTASLKWRCVNAKSSIIYYTKSNLDETYIRQLTKSLVQGCYKEMMDALEQDGWTDRDIQLNYLTTKNLEYTIDLQTGEQQFIGNALPQTPTLDFDANRFVRQDLEL